MQIIYGKCLHLSFLRRKNGVIKNESNGKSTSSLCSLFQWLIILSVKKKPAHISHLNFLWLWLQTFVLIILSSSKSQNYFSTQFLTRKNPIHYTALIPLMLFNNLNRLSSLSLHPNFYPALGSFLLLFSAPISIHKHPVTSVGISNTFVLPDLLSPVFNSDVDSISLSLPIQTSTFIKALFRHQLNLLPFCVRQKCSALGGGIARAEGNASVGLSLRLFSRTFSFTGKINGKGSKMKTEEIQLRVLHEWWGQITFIPNFW